MMRTATTTNGLVIFEMDDRGVTVKLACDTAFIPWDEWEFICRVYGKR